MEIVLALIAILASVQDGDKAYREALYQEIDRGDLEKAIELYSGIESDGTQPEETRAQAAFRRAWCLEKKGLVAEAKRAYGEVMSRYSAQAVVTGKAKTRRDGLEATPASQSRPLSKEDQIRELVLALGARDIETRLEASRTLVLMGDVAVAPLREALKHPDFSLRQMAATTLAEMKEDEGLYEILLEALNRNHNVVYPFSSILERHKKYHDTFKTAFRAEKDPYVLNHYLGVLGNVPISGLKDDVIGHLVGPHKMLVDPALSALRPIDEETFFTVLSKLGGVKHGDDRLTSLINTFASGSPERKIKDVKRLARLLTTHFPDHPEIYEYARGIVENPDELFLACVPTWLKNTTSFARNRLYDEFKGRFGKPGASALDRLRVRFQPKVRVDLVAPTLEEELPLGIRYQLAMMLLSHPLPEDEESRRAIAAALWKEYERPEPGIKDAAANGLLMDHVGPDHDRWEELVRREIGQPTGVTTYIKDDTSINEPFCILVKAYEKYPEPAKRRIRELVAEGLTRGSNVQRSETFALLVYLTDSDATPEVKEWRERLFSDLVLDATQLNDIRVGSLNRIGGTQAPPQVVNALVKLLKDKDRHFRMEAVGKLAELAPTGRVPGELSVLLPLVEDPDPQISRKVISTLSANPREEHVETFIGLLKKGTHRETVIGALGRSESLEAVPHLIPLLEDADPRIRGAVRTALENIKSRYEEIRKWKAWYEAVKHQDK